MKLNLVSIETNGFQHAGAWYELAELILYGCLRAGLDCTTSINRFASNRLNIVFGAMHITYEMERLIPKNTLFFNTEQLTNLSEEFDHQTYMQIRFLAQKNYGFLDYSSSNIPVLQSWGAREVILMPLGYVPELDRLSKLPTKYDCLFYGGLNKRRREILKGIEDRGLNLKSVFGIYGESRDALIRESKFVLNMHFYPSEIFELVRVNYLMHNRIGILTEINNSTKIEEEIKDLFIHSSREGIASAALDLVENSHVIEQKSSDAYDWLRSKPQETIIKTIFRN